jgi:hypothetical protein
MNHRIGKLFGIGLAITVALALAACGGTSAGSGGVATASTGGGANGGAVSSQPPAVTPPPSGGAVLTSVDPCELVPASEASKLAGVPFGPGSEHMAGDVKECVYGTITTNEVTISVVQAASVAQAQAAKQQLLADIQQQADGTLKVTQLDLADGAAEAEGSLPFNGTTLAARGIYVLKSTIAFGISNIVIGHDAPASSAFMDEANAALARLP